MNLKPAYRPSETIPAGNFDAEIKKNAGVTCQYSCIAWDIRAVKSKSQPTSKPNFLFNNVGYIILHHADDRILSCLNQADIQNAFINGYYTYSHV